MEKTKNKNIDSLIVGFAVFSMFFGSGNLIFPPFLGVLSGKDWLLSALGFVTTAVGLTAFGFVICVRFGGNVDALPSKIGKNFAIAFSFLSIFCVGPLLSIPRTAATTYSISVEPILGDSVPPLLVSVIFFAITYYFVIHQSTMVDRIGKILTPLLLIMVSMIVIKAVISPISVIADNGQANYYLRGFKEGYQTMDALGSMFIGSIAISGITMHGYKDRKDIIEVGTKSAIVAGICLATIYIGLTYVGATGSSLFEGKEKSYILITSVAYLLGDFGKYALALAMFLACLTTSIGLSATSAKYFTKLAKGKVSFNMFALIIAVFTTITSIMGLEAIISFAVPILTALYPVLIIMMLISIFDRYIKNAYVYTGAVIGTLAISITQALGIIFAQNEFLQTANALIDKLPFSNIGMPYLIPAVVVSFVFSLILKAQNPNVEFEIQ